LFPCKHSLTCVV